MKYLKVFVILSSSFALSACQSGNAGKQTTPSQQAVIDRAKDLQSADPSLSEGEAISHAAIEAIFLPGGWTQGKSVKAKREQDKFEEQLAKIRRK